MKKLELFKRNTNKKSLVKNKKWKPELIANSVSG